MKSNDYLSVRGIVDAVVDGKTKITAKNAGDMATVLAYLEDMKDHLEFREGLRKERIAKLESLGAPEVILTNEHRMHEGVLGEIKSVDDIIEAVSCIASIPDVCTYDTLCVINDSRRRGCRDCRWRFSDYEGGPGIDAHFHCGLHKMYSEAEKAEVRACDFVCDPMDPSRQLSAAEVDELLSGERPLLAGAGFNGPCDSYFPAPSPLFQMQYDKKGLQRVKERLAGKLPDLEEEAWDEEDVYVHMLFCEKNRRRAGKSGQELLSAIFGGMDEESGEEE